MTTSDAETSLKEGRLEDALAQLQAEVRKSPADAKLRVFLFQVLALLGQWERAFTQLNVCGELDAIHLAMVQTYREAIRCEMLREKVFAGETSPLVFGQPTQWLALLIEATQLCVSGQYSQAANLREQAFELAPATSGRLNGEPFAWWLADSDTRLGPVLEAIVNGHYYWMPYCRIAKIQLEAPVDLRDLVWLPAHFTWTNGGESVGLIPARYPGSASVHDPLLRLGRKTEWLEPGAGHCHGLGQRILTTDLGDYALFEVRELVLNADQEAGHG